MRHIFPVCSRQQKRVSQREEHRAQPARSSPAAMLVPPHHDEGMGKPWGVLVAYPLLLRDVLWRRRRHGNRVLSVALLQTIVIDAVRPRIRHDSSSSRNGKVLNRELSRQVDIFCDSSISRVGSYV